MQLLLAALLAHQTEALLLEDAALSARYLLDSMFEEWTFSLPRLGFSDMLNRAFHTLT